MRRRPRPSFPSYDEAAIGGMNTTPLIDVMLVLLILCMISIPVMNHKVTIDLPSGPSVPGKPPAVYHLTLNDAGQLGWNGAPISLGTLPRYLRTIEGDPRNQLEIAAHGGARYEDYDRMLAVVKRSGIERLQFVGNAGFAEELDR